MFSALFGSRGSSGGGGRARKQGAGSPRADEAAAAPASPEPGAVVNTETLAAVIATQKKRRRACARQATKAEHRRDSFLHKAENCVHVVDATALNEKAAQAEAVRKAKTAMMITLQAQVDVLERVLAESGLRAHAGPDADGGDDEEDFAAAAARMDRDERRLRADQEDIRVQQENAEEMSLLLSRGIALPFDEEDDEQFVLRADSDGFQQGEAM